MKLRSFIVHRLFVVSVIIIVGAAFASCSSRTSWTTFRGKDGAGLARSHVSTPIGLRWKILLQKHVGEDRFFNQPIVVDDTIFFGSSDGNFYSLDLLSGFMNWTARTDGPINSVPCIDKTNVYFGSSDGVIYAVNRITGETSWIFETEGAVNSTLVMWRGNIVVASDTDAVYVLAPEGGLLYQISNEYWYHNSFQVYDDRIVFAPGSIDEPFNLAIFDLSNERYLWSLEPSSGNYPWYSFPAILGGATPRLYYSATGIEEDGRLGFLYYCLDFETGEELWSRNESSELPVSPDATAMDLFNEGILLLDYGAPLLWRDRVIYASGDNALRSFNSKTGELSWTRRWDVPISSAVTVSGDRLYFGLRSVAGAGTGRAGNGEAAEDGALVCVSASTGLELWRVGVEGSILNSPVIAGSRIFFGTDAGCFYVFEEVL